MGIVGFEVGRLELWSCILGLGKKYGSALEECLVEPKTKSRTFLSKTRSLLDKSHFQTLAHQSSAR